MKMDIKDLPIKSIVVANNHRVDIEATKLDELMQSIKQNSMLQPITVSPMGGGKYKLRAGHRRLLACQKLGYKTISCSIRADAKDEAKGSILNITENDQRVNPTFAEIGRAIDELQTKHKMDMAQISVRLGRPEKDLKAIISTYRALPAKHRKKVKFMAKGSQDRKGCIPHTLATMLAQLKRDHGLTDDKFDKLIEYVQKNDTSKESLSNLVVMMNHGFDIETAKKKLEDNHIYHLEIVANKNMVLNLMKEYKCTNSGVFLKKIVYGQIPGIAKPDFIKLKD